MMKYNNQWVKEKFDQKESLEFLFFWGHTPRKDEKMSKACFSQWFWSTFVKDEITYYTAEHWMMAEKARLFEDEEMLTKILHSATPQEAKANGRKVSGFEDRTWKAHRYDIVMEGNRLKFQQNPSMLEFLLATEDAILVEASPYDRIWGIGMKASAEEIENPYYWQGGNLLGYALMEIRDELCS